MSETSSKPLEIERHQRLQAFSVGRRETAGEDKVTGVVFLTVGATVAILSPYDEPKNDSRPLSSPPRDDACRPTTDHLSDTVRPLMDHRLMNHTTPVPLQPLFHPQATESLPTGNRAPRKSGRSHLHQRIRQTLEGRDCDVGRRAEREHLLAGPRDEGGPHPGPCCTRHIPPVGCDEQALGHINPDPASRP